MATRSTAQRTRLRLWRHRQESCFGKHDSHVRLVHVGASSCPAAERNPSQPLLGRMRAVSLTCQEQRLAELPKGVTAGVAGDAQP